VKTNIMTSNTKFPSCGILGIGMCFGDMTFEVTLSVCPTVLQKKQCRSQLVFNHTFKKDTQYLSYGYNYVLFAKTETDLQINHHFIINIQGLASNFYIIILIHTKINECS
jgi:hypothetical protein